MKTKKIIKEDSEEMAVLSIRLQKKYIVAIDSYLKMLPEDSGRSLKRSDAARQLIVIGLKQQKILK